MTRDRRHPDAPGGERVVTLDTRVGGLVTALVWGGGAAVAAVLLRPSVRAAVLAAVVVALAAAAAWWLGPVRTLRLSDGVLVDERRRSRAALPLAGIRDARVERVPYGAPQLRLAAGDAVVVVPLTDATADLRRAVGAALRVDGVVRVVGDHRARAALFLRAADGPG